MRACGYHHLFLSSSETNNLVVYESYLCLIFQAFTLQCASYPLYRHYSYQESMTKTTKIINMMKTTIKAQEISLFFQI